MAYIPQPTTQIVRKYTVRTVHLRTLLVGDVCLALNVLCLVIRNATERYWERSDDEMFPFLLRN
jgi:hypothetical protein